MLKYLKGMLLVVLPLGFPIQTIFFELLLAITLCQNTGTGTIRFRSSLLAYYALLKLLTLFAHDVPTLPLIQRVFDWLLCREPIAWIWLAAAVRSLFFHAYNRPIEPFFEKNKIYYYYSGDPQ